MSTSSSSLVNTKNVSLSEQFNDLMIKYEALEEQTNVLKLEKEEFAKEISDLKYEVAILKEENDSYLELMDFGRQQSSLIHSISNSLDVINLDNDDLNNKVSDYKKFVTKLKNESFEIKKQNKKYGDVLEKCKMENEKKEEVYINKIKIFENKISELQNEVTALNKLNALTVMNNLNAVKVMAMDLEEKQFEPTTPKTNHDDVLKLHAFSTNRSNSNLSGIRPRYADLRSKSYSSVTDIDIYEHNMDEIDEDYLIDCGYNIKEMDGFPNITMPSSKRSKSANSDNINNYPVTPFNHPNSNNQFIIAQLRQEYETQLNLKNDDMNRLSEINDEQENIINELEHQIKKLQKSNSKLRREIDGSFKCAALDWFS